MAGAMPEIAKAKEKAVEAEARHENEAGTQAATSGTAGQAFPNVAGSVVKFLHSTSNRSPATDGGRPRHRN